MPTFPCPCCGFVVFERAAGSYEICPVCGWEDDPVQLAFPGTPTGANKESLYDSQARFLKAFPSDRQLHQGYRRDSSWRPLRLDEVKREGEPNTGREYFDTIPHDAPTYYWKAS